MKKLAILLTSLMALLFVGRQAIADQPIPAKTWVQLNINLDCNRYSQYELRKTSNFANTTAAVGIMTYGDLQRQALVSLIDGKISSYALGNFIVKTPPWVDPATAVTLSSSHGFSLRYDGIEGIPQYTLVC